MIGFIKGNIKFKTSASLIILTGGVGYTVSVPTPLITDYAVNSDIELFIHTNVKEDAIDLYGFTSFEELQLFELFLGVSGVGPKTSLAVFSYGKISKIKEAIIKGNVDFFTAVPRLGKKNAQKIIIELRSKLGNLGTLDLSEETADVNEIIDALKAFGFSASEAKEAIKTLPVGENSSTSDKIRMALKSLGKKR